MTEYDSDWTPNAHDVAALVKGIGAIFSGAHPVLVGAALCDLVAMFFAGHHPDLREQVLEEWTNHMHELIKVNEGMLLKRHPDVWDKPPTN